MNKNLFKTFAIAAMAVLAGACAKEQVASGDGETVEMTFNVDVPETTITTKGLSDAASVNELICQVFLKGAKDENKHFVYTPVPELTQNVAVVGGKATVKFSLVKGQTYSFAFWAQTRGTGYYTTDDLRSVTMNTDLVKANDPKMDAFFAIKDEARVTVSYSKNVSLKRALAQVNFGTKKYSGRSDELKAQKSYVTLTGVPNVFHPFMSGDSFACEGSETVKFNENEVISDETLSVNDAEYSYLASVYVFALNPDNTITDASAVVTLSNGKTTTIKAPNVPICRNFRTNILGNLLSVDGEWNITIDEKFNVGDLFYDPVGSAIEKGGEVTLEDDFSVVPNSYGLAIKKGVSTVLNLNGRKFENRNGDKNNKAALQVRGMLTINGDGDVICEGGADNNAVLVEDGGHLIINGGTYYVEKDANGKSNSTIYARKACTIEINGGVFSAEPNAEGKTPYVLNQDDDITVNCFSVKGGIFVGFNPAEVNENKGAITSFVAEGYRSVKIEYEGKEAWKVEEIPAVTTQEDFATAFESATSGSTIVLASGTYTIPKAKALSNVLFVGGENTIIDLTAKDGNPTGADAAYNNVTFKNIQFKTWTADYHGFRHCGVVNFENCTFSGKHFGYGVETYKHCTFNQSSVDYSIWTYSSTAVFEDCEFNCLGKAALVYREGNDATKGKVIKVVFNNCKFRASALAKGKAAIEIDSSLAPYEVYINKCTAEGFDNGSKSGNSLWNNKKGDSTNLKVVVDGVPQTLN